MPEDGCYRMIMHDTGLNERTFELLRKEFHPAHSLVEQCWGAPHQPQSLCIYHFLGSCRSSAPSGPSQQILYALCSSCVLMLGGQNANLTKQGPSVHTAESQAATSRPSCWTPWTNEIFQTCRTKHGTEYLTVGECSVDASFVLN